MSKLLLDSLLLHLIILLLFPISLLITLHDFSPTCKIYTLLYNISYALKKKKNKLSQAVSRTGRSSLLPTGIAIL